MKMVTAIPQTSLERLSKNSRMFSYLMTSFTKTYGVIQNDKMSLYFKGNKSVVSLALPLEAPVAETVYFSIDINKFLSAAKKIGDAMPLKLSINTAPPQILMTSDATNDKISFSATFYEADSAEILPLLSFYADRDPNFIGGEVFTASTAFLDFNHIASTYMGTINKNNSIALFQDKLVYADRTVVVSMKEPVWQQSLGTGVDEHRLLHKFILGFIDFVAPDNPNFALSKDYNFIRWQSANDPDFWAILAIDPCTISIPGQDDLDAITPEDNHVQSIFVKPSRLAEAIDFFSGLFEASVWKPITFTWSVDPATFAEKMVLSYHHPSTEIEKELAAEPVPPTLPRTIMGAEFTLISDSLRILLNRMLDTGLLEIRFNELDTDVVHGAGIQLKYTDMAGNVIYDAVLAKLQDA
jgi:hypothetical protein